VSEVKFFDIKAIDVFDVGTWNGKEWTDEDLDEMVANFNELSVLGYDFPGKLGHGEQELLDREDLPAAAYIKRLYRKGSKLVADFTRVPEKVKTLLELKAYRTVSAEIYDKVQLFGKTYENVVAAIAFLGGDIPAVGTLDDAIALYNRAHPFEKHPLGKPRVLLFGELADAERQLVSWDHTKEGSMANKNDAKNTVDDEVIELDAELTQLAERAADATKGRTGAPAFRAFLRDTITKLRGLSKKSKNAAGDVSFEDRRELVSAAVRLKWGSIDGYGAWITEMYDDRAIVSKDGSYFQVPYAIDDLDNVALGDAIEVEQIWQPKSDPTPATDATQNKAGNPGKEADMAITKTLATALGLPENADEPAVLKAIEDLKGSNTTLVSRIDKLEADGKTRDAAEAVTGAIKAHKILPAQKDWAHSYAAADLAGFKAFVEKAPEVFDTSEKGSATDAAEPKSEVATFRAKVAEKVKADTRDIDYGTKVTDAQRAVSVEEPELYAAIRTRR
jgi:hypothetical protein